MTWNQRLSTLTQQTVVTAVERWGGDAKTIQLTSLGINAVYRFDKLGQVFYMRITHPSLRKRSELEAAVAFQQYLSERSVTVCKPVLSKQNRWIESIPQQDTEFLVQVCEGVPGKAITFELKNDAVYETWGQNLAKLHQAASVYEPGKHVYSDWRTSIEELEGYVQKESTLVQKELAVVSAFLKSYARDLTTYGLTHGDHRKGNVLTDGKVVNIIDFDIPRLCWFLEDIIRPFFSAIAEESTHWQNKLTPYLKGYESVSTLIQKDKKCMPWFVRFKALEIYLWTKYNWDSDVAPGGIKTQTWLSQLLSIIEGKNHQLKVLQEMRHH